MSRSRPWMKEAVAIDQSELSWRLSTCCQLLSERDLSQRWQMPTISYFLFHIRALENMASAPNAILFPGLHAKHWPGNIFSAGLANDHH